MSGNLLNIPVFVKKTSGVATAPNKTASNINNDLLNSVFESAVYGTFSPENQKSGVITEIPGWCVLKDDEARQNSLNTYLSNIDTKEGQMAEVERLLSKVCSDKDVSFLTGTLKALKEDAQVDAARSMATKSFGSKKLENGLQVGVAESIPEMAADNQVPTIQIVAETGNEKAIKVAATFLYVLDKEDQVSGAQICSSAEVSDAANNEINKIIIDQNENCAIENQVDIYQVVLLNGSQEVKEYAASSTYKFDKTVQLDAAKVTVETGNEGIIKAGASVVSKYYAQNQVPAIQIYDNSEISESAKVQVDKILIDQYQDYAKENQVAIHKIMSESEYTETVEYAALNIYKLNKENQVNAVKITTETNNQEAIKAAAVKYEDYDDSVKAAIRETIDNNLYKSSKTECEISKDVKQQDIEEPTYKTTNIQDNEESIVENKTTDSKAKIAEVKEVLKGNNEAKIKESINNLSKVELISLFKECSNNSTVIKIVLEKNPSIEVLSKIDEKYIKQIGFKSLISQIGFLSSGAQTFIVKECAAAGKLDSIKRCMLLSSVKSKYDKFLNNNEKGKAVV